MGGRSWIMVPVSFSCKKKEKFWAQMIAQDDVSNRMMHQLMMFNEEMFPWQLH